VSSKRDYSNPFLESVKAIVNNIVIRNLYFKEVILKYNSIGTSYFEECMPSLSLLKYHLSANSRIVVSQVPAYLMKIITTHSSPLHQGIRE
jgi:hypothetical protein